MNGSTLTILFEAPFWIGLYERLDESEYSVCKITFGSEPKDYEVYDFILKNWGDLKFSPSLKSEPSLERRISPKRMQREISARLKAGSGTGAGTKAQQALKLQHEQAVKERKALCREKADAETERRFALKQKKKLNCPSKNGQ